MKYSLSDIGIGFKSRKMAQFDGENFSDKTFMDIESGIRYVEEFAKKYHHPLSRCSRTTVAQFNRKIVAEDLHISNLPDDAVYSIRWTCKNFGCQNSKKGLIYIVFPFVQC